MAKQTINIGTTANDGTGSSLRGAFDICNDNFTEIYDAATPSGANITFAGNASLADGGRARFGAGGDFAIYHNGTDTFLDNSTGDLKIRQFSDDKDIIFQSDNGSGGVQTYFSLDGSVEQVIFEKSLKITDNDKILVGTGEDLEIYHDGSNSFIENSTGILNISQKLDDGVIKLNCDDGSGGTTRYIQIDGSVEKTFFFKNARHEDNVKAEFGSSGDLEIYHDGSNAIIDNDTGDIILRCDSDDIKILAEDDILLRDNDDSTNFIHCINGGAVKLYHNGSEKFETTSTGATVTGVIAVNSGTTYTAATFTSSDASVAVDFVASDNSMQIATSSTDGILKNNGGGSLRFFNNGSERVRVDGSGNVGIGLTSPDTILNVKSSGSNEDEISLTHSGNTVKIASLGQESGHGSLRLRTNGGVSTVTVSTDGTDSTIKNATGDLIIENTVDDKDVVLKSDDGSGGTTEYFRLDGGNTNMVASKTILYSDSVKASFGNSEDLRIQHNGTDTFIQNFTGDLQIQQQADDKDILFRGDNGSGGIQTYFRLNGDNTDVIFDAHIELEDNVELRIGSSGADLRMLHSGTDSFVQNFTGDLQIQQQADDKDILFRCDDGSGSIATYFFLDGSEVNTRFPKDAQFSDNVKAKFGDSGDLEIFHDGSHSRIKDAGTGHLTMNATDFVVNNSADSANMIIATDGGSVDLYHSGSKKFETSSTGATVTGALNITGALSKGSGSFKIDHPVKPDTHYLYHSFVESPLTDLIYRGKSKLVKGKATVNIDKHFGMTDGTFAALVDDKQVFTTNEDGWDAVKGKIEGNELHIECQNESFDGYVSWLVIGDRKDKHIMNADWTDEKGKPILETEK